MSEVLRLYNQAIAPQRLDGVVRFIFFQAKEFEFIPETGHVLPTELVSVSIYPEFVNGGMQPPYIKDFADQAGMICYYTRIFLNNTNQNSLSLPAHISIGTGSKSYVFPIPV